MPPPPSSTAVRRARTLPPPGRRVAIAACLAAALLSAASAPADPPGRATDRLLDQIEPRLRAIVEADEFRSRSFDATWLPDGSGALTLEAPEGAAAEIARYDTATGERTVLVGGDALLAPGTSERLVIHGFRLSPSGRTLLLHTDPVSGSDHWLHEPASGSLRPVTVPAGVGFDANAFSPDERRLLGSLGGNLLVFDIPSGHTITLTADGDPGTIDNGSAAWSPDGRWITFVRSDASDVPKRAILVPGDPTFRTFREARIERIGGPISRLQVGVVSADGGDTRWIPLPDEPGTFYLNPPGWAGNSAEVLIDIFSRFHDMRRVLLADHHSGAITTAYTDTDTAWVDQEQGGLEWIGDSDAFVVFSERDGWRRAWVVRRDGSAPQPITAAGCDIIDRGFLDATNGWLSYYASPDDATQRFLFRARLDGTGAPERLTPTDQPGSHRYTFSPDGRFAFHTRSTFDMPPVTDLVALPGHESLRVLEDNAPLAAAVKPLITRPTDFLELDIGDGVLMDAWMIKPRDFDPARKYPLFVFVYGEPAGQTVLDDWHGGQGFSLFHRAIADLGYLVVSIDNRGTPAPKGAAWRRAVFGSLGPLSTAEQAAGLEALERQCPFVDRSRVGIWGWSGGGSNTLNALFRRPDDYDVGIAVVPKPMPEYYWAGYQEMYMRTPEGNPEGYRTCAPITYAEGLRGDLLIITGSGETNTHVEITEGLVDRLVELGKRFDYFVYPHRDHGLSEGPGTPLHLRMLIVRYLLEHLPPGPR